MNSKSLVRREIVKCPKCNSTVSLSIFSNNGRCVLCDIDIKKINGEDNEKNYGGW